MATESGEMRALRMLAKHGEAVISSATTEPGKKGAAGWANYGHPTVAVAALVFIKDYFDVEERTDGLTRRWAILNNHGRALCETLGIEVDRAEVPDA